MLQQIREAEEAIEQENYSDAVLALGKLLQRDVQSRDLSELSGQDFFLDAGNLGPNQARAQQSLFKKARKLVGELPSKALETYRLKQGPLAAQRLNDAIEARDWDLVRQVRREHFHTFAGYEASFLLAQRAMFEGHALEASMLLDDLIDAPGSVDHLGESIRVIYEEALLHSKRDMTSLAKASGSSREKILDSHLQDIEAIEPYVDADYSLFGGTLNRNGRNVGEMPLANERWMLPTTASPRQTRTLQQVAGSLATSGKLPPPSWTPIRVGDQLLMRTTERLVGVDYRTGKRVWMYPWFSANKQFDTEKIDFDAISNENHVLNLLSQRVWNDLPYGQISSDGERVFMIADLEEVEMTSISPIMGIRATRATDAGSNTLVALDLATEGKLLWRLGKSEAVTSTLSDAFFLGPPLPLDGRLYVMAELAGDLILICLDPATGKEYWRQHLVAVESGKIDLDPIRRVAGATPTYHEGILICPTGAGATVAVDLADRMLRWGVTYSRNDDPSRSMMRRTRGVEASQLMQRWFSGVAVADGHAVLVTPVESERLFALNLLSGEKLFSEKNRLSMRYLAGIRDGRFFLVGANQVSAYDLETGHTIWATSSDLLSVGQQIAGRGVFGDGFYLLPTTSNQIIKIDLEDGSILDRRDVQFHLGNLIASKGEIISQGTDTISVAYGEASLGPRVERALKANPDDLDALIQKAELLLQGGKRIEALNLLDRARKHDPKNIDALMLSVSAMLDSLRTNPQIEGELVETLDELIDQPEQRIELLALQARAAIDQQQYLIATETLLKLSEMTSEHGVSEGVAARMMTDPARKGTLDAWIAARANFISDSATEDELELINDKIRRSLSNKLHASNTLLSQLHQHFGSFEGSEAIRQTLYLRYMDDRDYLKAKSVLLGVNQPMLSQLESVPSPKLLQLLKIYLASGAGDDAIELIDLLESRVDIKEDESLVDLRKMANSLVSETQWADEVHLQWQPRPRLSRAGMPTRQVVAETNHIAGEAFRGWKLASEGAYPLAVRDRRGYVHGLPLEEQIRQRDLAHNEATIVGSMMVVVTPTSLIAIDLDRLQRQDSECVLWQHSLSSDGTPLLKRRSNTTKFGDQMLRYILSGTVARANVPEFSLGPILGDRVLALIGGELVSHDLFDASIQWRNADAPVSGEVLSFGKQIAVVSDKEQRIVFYDVFDGKILRETKWSHGEIRAGVGRYVLAFDSSAADERKYTAKLVDPFKDEVILEKDTWEVNRGSDNLPTSFGRIVDGRWMTMLDTDGTVTIWDLVRGKDVGSTEVPAYENLTGMHAMSLGDRIIVLPRRRREAPNVQANGRLFTQSSSDHETADAVFVLSLEDANLRWKTEFDIPWGCSLQQPDATPLLFLSRSRLISPTPRTQARTLDLVGLDVNNGVEKVSVLDKQVISSSNALETQVKIQPGTGQRVHLSIGVEKVELHFGEKPEEEEASDNGIEDLFGG